VKGGESLSSTTLAYDEEQKKLRQSLLQSIDAHDANKSSGSSTTKATKGKKSADSSSSSSDTKSKAADSNDSSDDDVLQVTVIFNTLIVLHFALHSMSVCNIAQWYLKYAYSTACACTKQCGLVCDCVSLRVQVLYDYQRALLS
jgi:hypothetical protein